MRIAWSLALALFAAGAVGCDGPLAGGTGTGGTGTGGSTGGGAGTAGSTGGGAGTAGSPEIANYAWGDVTVQVAPTYGSAGDLVLTVIDQAAPPALSGTNVFPFATKWNPNDGAYVAAHYTCTSPGLYEVDVFSCANQSATDLTAAASGCLAVAFRTSGVSGEFIHPNGARCEITAATASIQLPPPVWTTPPAGAPPPGAATGSFSLDCTGSDGTDLKLQAQFVLPVQSWTLLC